MFDGLNDSVLSAFAEPFTCKGPAGDVVLQGVFDEQADRERFGGIDVQGRVFTLSLKQADVAANGIARHETVRVRGMDYQIIGIDADVAGMATLILRAY